MAQANRGKLVIVAILAAALAAAVFSVFFHYRGGQRSHDFWGTTTAVLIAEAPQVRVLKLEALEAAPDDAPGDAPPAGDPPPTDPAVEFGNQFWKVADARDAVTARGLGNIRRALVQDVTYDWRTTSEEPPDWQFALEFNDGRLGATVLFDFESRQVALTGGRRIAMLDPAAAADWRTFFFEQFAEPAPEATNAKDAEASSDDKPPNEAQPASER